jgi:hypothetical protein
LFDLLEEGIKDYLFVTTYDANNIIFSNYATTKSAYFWDPVDYLGRIGI